MAYRFGRVILDGQLQHGLSACLNCRSVLFYESSHNGSGNLRRHAQRCIGNMKNECTLTKNNETEDSHLAPKRSTQICIGNKKHGGMTDRTEDRNRSKGIFENKKHGGIHDRTEDLHLAPNNDCNRRKGIWASTSFANRGANLMNAKKVRFVYSSSDSDSND